MGVVGGNTGLCAEPLPHGGRQGGPKSWAGTSLELQGGCWPGDEMERIPGRPPLQEQERLVPETSRAP